MNYTWIQRLVSAELLGIVLLTAPSALADSDRDSLVEMQILDLNPLYGKVRDVNPTKWELEALQSLVKESNCLSDRKELSLRLKMRQNRDMFAFFLDKCFTELEKVATDKDPDKLIRKNLLTLQRLRNESLPELVKRNSSYIGNSALSAQLRILTAFSEKDISADDMRSLRYLIYRYPQTIQYGYQGFPCEISNYSKIQKRPINRQEFAGVLIPILDRINEFVSSSGIEKIDKTELSIVVRLSKEFEGEMATYRGILCALEANLKLDLNTYLDAKSVGDLDYISKLPRIEDMLGTPVP
jgi:hypothetical protein